VGAREEGPSITEASSGDVENKSFVREVESASRGEGWEGGGRAGTGRGV